MGVYTQYGAAHFLMCVFCGAYQSVCVRRACLGDSRNSNVLLGGCSGKMLMQTVGENQLRE